MSKYRTPGVYVEEVERGAKSLEGVSTSTAGFLGRTERGPTDPRLLTSFSEFRRLYGGYVEESHLYTAIDGFFRNGGGRCYVGRVTGSEVTATISVPTQAEMPGGNELQTSRHVVDVGNLEGEAETEIVLLENVGAGEDDISIDGGEVEFADPDPFEAELLDEDGEPVGDDTLTLEPGDSSTLRLSFEAHGADVATGTLTIPYEVGGDDADEPPELVVRSTDGDPGAGWLAVDETALDFGAIRDDEAERPLELTNLGAASDDTIEVTNVQVAGPDADSFPLEFVNTIDVDPDDEGALTVPFEPETDGPHVAHLEIEHEVGGSDGANSPLYVTVTGSTAAFEISAIGPGDWAENVEVELDDATMYEAGENELFELAVRYWRDDEEAARARDPLVADDEVEDPDVEEIYDDLSPDPSSSNYYVNQVGGSSAIVDVDPIREVRPDVGTSDWLAGNFAGDDPVPDIDDYRGVPEGADVDPEDLSGFAGFSRVEEISLVCVPDEHDIQPDLTDAVVTHCEEAEDRFAILQAAQNPGTHADVEPPVDSDYAAFYYPWLEVANPESGVTDAVPPGGHVAGIYARTDGDQGVHKAPANEVVRGIRGLQRTIGHEDQAGLNPIGVNCIRELSGRGIRVWGARTTSSDPDWKYVNVRRLFIFLAESIDRGTQWVVFEPNNEQLWARVEQTIENFLTDVWEDGALMGTSPDEAFFVTCDRSTMTQNDIENGRLICEIGVAPVRPAEFVVFRISQWTSDS